MLFGRHGYRWQLPAHLLIVVHFGVIILDELVDEALVFVQDLLAHIRNVVEDSLVLHKEVCLHGAPRVVAGERGHRGEGGERDLVCGRLAAGRHRGEGDSVGQVDVGAGDGRMGGSRGGRGRLGEGGEGEGGC